MQYDPNPAPGDPISITQDEFDLALVEFEAAGVPLKADREQAWRDFAGWRVNYDSVLQLLAKLVMAPPRGSPIVDPNRVRAAPDLAVDRAGAGPPPGVTASGNE